MNKPQTIFKQAYSGNYSKGRSISIQRIVLHWIVGEISASDAVFTKKQARPRSAHYAIGSNGEIHQYVKDADTAWHAGNANAGSIGIEHAGGQLINGARKKPTTNCHESSAKLVAWLCVTYKIPCNRTYIRKHNEYMQTTCPGLLDVDYIINRANQIINSYNKPPMANKNDVYYLYKSHIDKHAALFNEIRPDVVKSSGSNFTWEHMIVYTPEYLLPIKELRELKAKIDTHEFVKAQVRKLYKQWIDQHKALFKEVRPDVVKAYGEDGAWEHLIQYASEYLGAIKRKRELEIENAKLKEELAKQNPVVDALNAINETLKSKS